MGETKGKLLATLKEFREMVPSSTMTDEQAIAFIKGFEVFLDGLAHNARLRHRARTRRKVEEELAGLRRKEEEAA